MFAEARDRRPQDEIGTLMPNNEQDASPDWFIHPDFEYDRISGKGQRSDGVQFVLAVKERLLLNSLSRQPNVPVGREELMREVGVERGRGNPINVLTYRLRKKLSSEPSVGAAIIKGIPHYGYELVDLSRSTQIIKRESGLVDYHVRVPEDMVPMLENAFNLVGTIQFKRMQAGTSIALIKENGQDTSA